MEIEKKYLIRYLPADLEEYPRKEIEQGYLNRRPTLRIRKSNSDYILTYKGKEIREESGVIAHEEIEVELTETAYLHLLEKVDNHPVTKTRYIIPLGSCGGLCGRVAQEDKNTELKAELDVFHGILEGLVFVEVEFPSIEAAGSFNPPEWFGADVSDDKRYRNGVLSELDSLDEMYASDKK